MSLKNSQKLQFPDKISDNINMESFKNIVQ